MERDPNHSGDTEQSDQLPEEAPPEVAEKDTGPSRDDAEDSAGVPDDPDRATGHSDDEG